MRNEVAELQGGSKRKRSRAGKAGKAGGISRPKNSLSHDVCDKLSQPKRDTRKEAAKRAGVSRRKMEQAAFIKKEAPVSFAQVKEGELTLSAAVRDIKKGKLIKVLEDIKTKEVKLLEGKFDVLVIDPPWPIKKIERDVRPNQSEIDYPTMTIEEIGSYFIEKIYHADDCHLWLWTTHKFFPDAMKLLADWSAKYVCTFVWHKPGGFQPIGLPQYNCEFCLYGRIGNPAFIDTKAFFTCFNADRGKHSEKPDCFYETVTRVTAGLRGAPFERKPRPGFEVGGNEV
jgi:N6-adenosine-specific RNA methylase IME4